MALLEINLRKPALMEEVVGEESGESARGRGKRAAKSESKGGGSALRKLGMVGFVLAAIAIARAVRGRQSSSEPEGIEVPIEDGSSGSSGKGQGRRMAGIVLGVLGAVALARRMRSGGQR